MFFSGPGRLLLICWFVYVNLNSLILIFIHTNVKLQLVLVNTVDINAAAPHDKKLKAFTDQTLPVHMLCRAWILWIHSRLTRQCCHCLPQDWCDPQSHLIPDRIAVYSEFLGFIPPFAKEFVPNGKRKVHFEK